MSHVTTAPRLIAVEGGHPKAVYPGTDHPVLTLAALLANSVGFHFGWGAQEADPDTPKMRSPMRSRGHRCVPPAAVPHGRSDGGIVDSASVPGPHQGPDRGGRLFQSTRPRLPGNFGHSITPPADR